MAVPWPTELSDLLDSDSFGYSIGDTVIRSDMDTGPAKLRRRSTKGIDKVTCSQKMAFDDFQTVYDFFDIDLNGGVTPFTFNHPFTGVPTDWRFISPPEFKPLGNGGIEFGISMSWEKLP